MKLPKTGQVSNGSHWSTSITGGWTPMEYEMSEGPLDTIKAEGIVLWSIRDRKWDTVISIGYQWRIGRLMEIGEGPQLVGCFLGPISSIDSTIVGDDVNNNAGTIFMSTDSRDKLVVKAEPGDRLTPRLPSPDIKKAWAAWHSSSPSPGPSKALCRARLGLTKPGLGSARPAGLGRALNITI
ncbi:hypothetical protein B0H13DRAFT_1918130 [Mycena leptocephala]|nr:hypothetical protein B0H13DRAFT_1918130 [Mycena leptocephala]